MIRLPDEISRFMLEMEAQNRERMRLRIKADPKAHKLTLLMEKHARYLYWDAEKDGRGRSVRFGYTTGRNCAGYFLSFREVRDKNGKGKRDQFAARKVRKRAAALAKARCDRFKDKRAI